jgi:signal transduction histidine kinase
MTPPQQPAHDAEALQELGRASVEIVHDIKNQLNGLKLYATFLRKRCERADRPADEIETVNKIVAGLERAANDLSTLVRFGRPLDLHRAPGTDLAQLVRAADDGAEIDAQDKNFQGDFDAGKLRDALREITALARAHAADGERAHVSLRREETSAGARAVVEWRGVNDSGSKDIFRALDGNDSLRAALAARVIRAHDGEVEHHADTISVRLPLNTVTSDE